MKHEACINTLNDLVQVNNDRIAGYQKAIDALKDRKDDDLKIFFRDIISEGREYIRELSSLIQEYGGKAATGPGNSGKLYNAWRDIKITFAVGDGKTVLKSCEADEDATQRIYQMALDDKEVMEETKDLIDAQKSSLMDSYDEIKEMRNLEL